MSQELKVRVDNPENIEKLLLARGGKPAGETHFVDIYFNQPADKVLKIAWHDNTYFLDKLQATNGTFQIVSSQKIADPEAEADKLSSEHGIKRTLRGHRRFFQLGDYRITINTIDKIGDFLIVTGESPPKSFVEQDLGIKNPEYITVSFDELPSKTA